VAELGRRGFHGLTLPPEWGGVGGDTIAYCLTLEELARADAGIAITVEAHISLGCALLVAFGTPEQRARFLLPLAGGAQLRAFGLTEAGAGTDADTLLAGIGTDYTAEAPAGEAAQAPR